MIKDLQEQTLGSSNTEIKNLISKLITDFENCMNNNLEVKNAFDGLYEKINELHKKRKLLNIDDVKNMLSNLRQIDSVLQCIF